MRHVEGLWCISFVLFFLLPVAVLSNTEHEKWGQVLSKATTTIDEASLTEPDVSLDEHVSPFVAPKCWKSATRILMDLETPSYFLADWKQEGSGASHLCQSMSEHHQKYLALAIAKCHLLDMNLALYKSSDYVQRNCQDDQPPQDIDQLYGCLQSLTQHGVDAYTHYVSHVQILCSRLTHGVWLAYQQESQSALLHAFRGMAQESTAHADNMRRTVLDLSFQLDDLANVPANLKEEMSHEIKTFFDAQMGEVTTRVQDAVEVHVNDQLHASMNRLLESLSSQYYSQWEQMSNHISQQEKEQELRHAQWVEEQNRLFDGQKQEMRKQFEALSAQRDYIQSMTNQVTEVAESMKSFSALEILAKYARLGYSWLMTGLYFIVALNFSWLFTRPSVCRGLRSYLFMIVCLEAVFEIYLSVAPKSENVTEAEYELTAYDVRLLTACLCAVIYGLALFGALLRWLLPFGDAEDEPNKYGDKEASPAFVPQSQSQPHMYPGFAQVHPAPYNPTTNGRTKKKKNSTVLKTHAPPAQVYCVPHAGPQVIYNPHFHAASAMPMLGKMPGTLPMVPTYLPAQYTQGEEKAETTVHEEDEDEDRVDYNHLDDASTLTSHPTTDKAYATTTAPMMVPASTTTSTTSTNTRASSGLRPHAPSNVVMTQSPVMTTKEGKGVGLLKKKSRKRRRATTKGSHGGVSTSEDEPLAKKKMSIPQAC